MMKPVKPFNINNFHVPPMNARQPVSPMGRGMLLDDIARDIIRRIEAHERMVFAHVHRHNCRCEEHHKHMQFVHPHHSHRTHPLHRRF